MFDQFRLSILTFPQRFDGSNLSIHVLILPQIGTQWNGNPLLDLPLGFPNAASTGPPLAQASLSLEARIISDLGQFPTHAPVDGAMPLDGPIAFPDAAALFAELQNQFQIKNTILVADLADAPKPNLFIKKYLTPTYRRAFHFTRPRVPEAVTDDSYHCAIREDKQPNPAFQPSPPEITWGEVYAYCLRHPSLARRLGLIREFSFAIDATAFESGGFLYITLGTESDYLTGLGADEHFNFVRHYAARIPTLEAGTARSLFAPVLFPVLFNVAGPDGNYDQVFIEAAEYDDGFAKIVHANQPISQNLLVEEEDGFPPLHDVGIRLGWDDEQVLIWQNRQLKEDQPGSGKRIDAPLGVFGYRVDVRQQGETDWHSLVRVQSKTSLQLGPVNLGTYAGEFGIEVHPMQLDGDQANGQFWLPSYFSNWNGQSLVLPDEDAALLYKTEQAENQAVILGRLYNPVGVADVPLRYSRIYDFRVRLMDATSGGPMSDEQAVHEAPAPVGTLHFRRFVQPEPLRVEDLPRLPDAPLDTYFPGNALTIRRPLLGYPSVVFTGKYSDPIPLLEAASDAAAGEGSFGIPDPDVLEVQIDVEVRTLKMDNQLSLSGEEPFIHLYTTFRAFPADFDAPLSIPLEFRDVKTLRFGNPADLGDLGVNEAELLNLTELVLPTGREIRLTLRGIGETDSGYYGSAHTHLGKPIQVKVRRESADERKLLADLSLSRQIRGIYLQPDPPQPNDRRIHTLLFRRGAATTPAIIQRLAQQLDVDHKRLTLVGKKGQRVVFGCSRHIRHTLAPDNSSLTFATKDELLNHWIVALTLQVDRDWTWDMLEEVSFEIFREQKFQADDEVDDNQGQPIGDLEMKGTAPINALYNPDRSKTTLIYLDAVEPKSNKPQVSNPQETAFPDIIELTYRIEPRFKQQPDQQDVPATLPLTLPVTTPPAQVPRIVSAGLALSQYRRNDDYSATEPRERYLWLEFEEPVKDPNDAYFIRLLGYAPDPLLSDNRTETFIPPDEPALNIDPEVIRVIIPGQSDDQAGVAAMQPLEKATHSDRHFLVPLPSGLHAESNELFGFFTYELRVGHALIWSTAQGRFGRPLRTTGVQHPAPTLFCTCHRDEVELLVQAPHAMAVRNGKNITADPPRTDIWVLLYAQVRQADGKDNRNILLDERRLNRIPGKYEEVVTPEGALVLAKSSRNGQVWSSAYWEDAEVKALLGALGLPIDASLSIVCVEMMPHLGSFQQPAATAAVHVTQRESTFIEGVHAARGNVSGTATPGTAAPQDSLRPLSNQLGHFRILRTSPLTPVPDVC
jgi:hypothetical protein